MSLLQPDDLVFYKEDGKVMSAGYAVNNVFADVGVSLGQVFQFRAGVVRMKLEVDHCLTM